MNGMFQDQHEEAVDQTVEWARQKFNQHADLDSWYWFTDEGREVAAIAECEGWV